MPTDLRYPPDAVATFDPDRHEVVGEFLTHYGITIEPTGTLETVLFRYQSGLTVDAMAAPNVAARLPYRIVATFVSADGQRYSTTWWKVDDPLNDDERAIFDQQIGAELRSELGSDYREVSRIILQEDEAA